MKYDSDSIYISDISKFINLIVQMENWKIKSHEFNNEIFDKFNFYNDNDISEVNNNWFCQLFNMKIYKILFFKESN